MNTLALVVLLIFGTISCTATNAGITGKATITIEQGCKLSMLLNLDTNQL